MPSHIEPGAWGSVFFLDEKKIKKLVEFSLDRGSEKLVALHLDRRPPAGKNWEEYGTAYANRYFEAEIEVPAFDYDAAPELGEKTIITMRGYAGLNLNCVGSPADVRDFESSARIEVHESLYWL